MEEDRGGDVYCLLELWRCLKGAIVRLMSSNAPLCYVYVIQLCKCLALNTSLAICTLWPDSNHSFLPVPCVLLVLIQRSRLPNYIKAAG